MSIHVMAPTLNLLVLKSANIEALREFYEGLGLVFTAEKHGRGPAHFSATIGTALLELYPLDDEASPSASSRLGFSVADVDATVAAIESVGARVISKARETRRGYLALVEDPDGRTIELVTA